MADNRAEIAIDGNATGFRRAMREVQDAARDGVGRVEGTFSGMLATASRVQAGVAAIATVFTAGAFGTMVRNVAAAGEEIARLSQLANAGVEEFQEYAAGAKTVGIEQDKLADILKDVNDKVGEFLAVGGGPLKDFFEQVAPKVGVTADQFARLSGPQALQLYVSSLQKAGLSQQQMTFYMEALASDATGLLPLLRDNGQAMREYGDAARDAGAIMSAEAVSAAREFERRMSDLNASLTGFRNNVVAEVLPAVTRLITEFSEGTRIAGGFGNALKLFGLQLSPFDSMADSLAKVRAEMKSVQGLIDKMDQTGRNMAYNSDPAAGFGARMMGRNEAMARLEELQKQKAFLEFQQRQQALALPAGADARDARLFPPAKPDGENGGDATKKTGAAKSQLPQLEAALEAERALAAERGTLRDFGVEQELAYWQKIVTQANLSASDRLAVERKISRLIVDVRRGEMREATALEAESVRSREAIALGRVEVERAAAQEALAAGQITRAQALGLEMEFEARRTEIARMALAERLRMAEADPTTSPAERARIQAELEQLELQHQVRMGQIRAQQRMVERESADESMRIWDDLGNRMTGLWDKGIQAMMNGTLTWRNGMRAVGTEVVGWFAQQVVGEMVKKWIAGKALELAVTLGFLSQQEAAQMLSSGKIVGAKVSEATTVVGAEAAKAGAGAASSQASIPYVGPILALAAMAAVFAAVSGMSGNIKSAAGGYDIPAGINPMTQLHEQEMVLPANLANTVRRMAGEGEEGSVTGQPVNFTVNAMDGASVRRLFEDNGHVLARVLRQQARDFARG